MTTAHWLIGPLLLGCVSVAGCHPQIPPVPTTTLVMSVSPPLATVLLDDQPILLRTQTGGPARLKLPVGAHRLEVRALSHLTAYRDVVCKAGEESVLSITLRRDPDADSDSETTAPKPFSPRPPELPARF
jgi:hypothetical protein